MSTTSIEWTEATWQVTSGCTKVSPGCRACYAETMANRLAGMARKDIKDGRDPGRKRSYLNVINKNGAWNNKIELLPDNLSIPLKRKKPTTWFVNSMSDLFHEGVPFEFVDRVFAVMALTPRHTYQILTKRTERMAGYFSLKNRWVKVCNVVYEMERASTDRKFADHAHRIQCDFENHELWPLPNVWLGTSCEDQQRAGERIPHLLKCPAAIRFISAEPLLGPIDLHVASDFSSLGHGPSWMLPISSGAGESTPTIDWVISGGESGHGARPCNIEWIRSIVSQCKAASVPVFVKQLGAKPTMHCGLSERVETGQMFATSAQVVRDAQGLTPINLCGWNIKDKKGGDPSEWPEDLRVREMPQRKTVTR